MRGQCSGDWLVTPGRGQGYSWKFDVLWFERSSTDWKINKYINNNNNYKTRSFLSAYFWFVVPRISSGSPERSLAVTASQRNGLFSLPVSVLLLLCYAGLSTVGARAVSGEGGEGGKENLPSAVKSVWAVTSAEPPNELVALPQSRSQETNHSSRFKTEGYCWAGWTLRFPLRTFPSPLFCLVMVSRIRVLFIFLFIFFWSHCRIYMRLSLSACQIAYQTGVGC